ncbi:MAG: hypothetical protein ABIB43_06605, partial [archaeon]
DELIEQIIKNIIGRETTEPYKDYREFQHPMIALIDIDFAYQDTTKALSFYREANILKKKDNYYFLMKGKGESDRVHKTDLLIMNMHKDDIPEGDYSFKKTEEHLRKKLSGRFAEYGNRYLKNSVFYSDDLGFLHTTNKYWEGIFKKNKILDAKKYYVLKERKKNFIGSSIVPFSTSDTEITQVCYKPNLVKVMSNFIYKKLSI